MVKDPDPVLGFEEWGATEEACRRTCSVFVVAHAGLEHELRSVVGCQCDE